MPTGRSEPFDAAKYLDSDEAIAEYLSACLEEGGPALLVSALGDAARAKGVSDIADKSGVGRERLCEVFPSDACPSFETVVRIVQAMGLRLSISTLS